MKTLTIFHPVQTHNSAKALPEPIVLRAYEVYCHVYGEQSAMVNVEAGCRGGFSTNELIAFLYARSFPKDEWRQRMDEAFERQQATKSDRTDPA